MSLFDLRCLMEQKYHPLKWIIWSLAVLFYFYEYFLRVSPSIMLPELMKAFGVQATAVGFMTAFYLYAYAPMQLPVGVLADKYGARRLLTFASLTCGVGGLLMGFAYDLWIGEIARLLMGFGSAFAFVSMIYVCTHWFAKRKWAIMIGIGNSLGMLGAVIGLGPLRIATNSFGWRAVMIFLGLFGLALALIIYLVVRNEPTKVEESAPHQKDEEGLLHGLKIIMKNPLTWLNGLVSTGYYSVTVNFAGLWGVSYLKSAYNLSPEMAGFAGSMIFLGWVVGGPTIGFAADKWKRRRPPLVLFTFLTLVVFTPIVYFDLSLPLAFVLLFLTGLFSSAQLLNYSYAIEVNPISAKGTSIAFTNCLTFLGNAALQPAIGLLLDLGWDGTKASGIPIYSASDYHRALTVFPLLLLFAFLLSFFLRDKPHAQIHADLPM